MTTSVSNRDVFLAILVAFLWGTEYVMVELMLQELPVFTLLILRFFFITFPLIFFFPKPPSNFLRLFFLSMTYVVFYLFSAIFAIKLGFSSAWLVIIDQIAIVFSVLWGILLFKESIGIRSIIGLIVVIFGTLLFLWGSLSYNVKLIAGFLAIFNAFSWSLFSLQIKLLKTDPHPYSLLAWLSLFGLILSIPMAFIFNEQPVMEIMSLSSKSIIILVYTVLFCNLIGNYIWFALLSRNGIGNISVYIVIMPVFGVMASYIFLDTQLDGYLYSGGVLIILGSLLLIIRRVKTKRFLEQKI